MEKVRLADATLLTVPLVNVDGNDGRSSGHNGRVVVQEVRLSKLIFANLIYEIYEALILIIVQDSQVPFESLHRGAKVEIEAEFGQNFFLEVYELRLRDNLLLGLGKQRDHAVKVG